MNKAILLLIPVAVVAVAAATILLAPQPYRAILMALPAVEGVSDECIYNNVIDVIEAYVNGTIFTSEEYISLSCSSATSNYTVELYLSLNPVDENRIGRMLNESEPALYVLDRPLYYVSGNRLLAKQHSTLYLYSFYGFSEQNKQVVINDSFNSRNYYDLNEMFLFLNRIPDSTLVIDSSLYQKQVFFSDELKTALKGWYIGTTRLASQQGFVVLRQPGGMEKKCYDWDNETTIFGIFYKCYGNGTCGPKYLTMSDAEAYAMDANDMSFTCSSVEDAFTDEIMKNIR
jgi:hypothetical protein